MWRRFMMPLRLIVSGGLLTYLILSANPAAIWDVWRRVDLPLLGLALLVQFAGVALSAAKWGLLLRARGQQQPYRWLLGSYLAGQFANNFLPTTVGGDALRVTQLGRRIGSYSQAGASVFLERLTGFLALSAIAGVAMLLTYTGINGTRLVTQPAMQLLTAGFALAALAAMVGSIIAPQLHARLGAWLPAVVRSPLQHVATALSEYAPRGAMLAAVMGMSLLFQSLWIAMHVVCGLALGLDTVPLLLYVLMVTITDILGLAPIFFNNLGAREGIFILYMSQIGIAQPTAVALALMVFSVRLIVSILGGLVILFGGGQADLTKRADTRADALSTNT
jgi:hypothetical protein